ncbi:lipopolysaccharide biosynthesis protein [Caulobacter sp. NIBR2454]|uniref:lipopolysaccharide biosynthesis protein n=1 Tax=Caulobacter sp. NIBR2454 TaxID=3015996 RepID=UPI0022B6E1BB|nr:lipopolysaccharide biosynthesis protein [Caulobacter sp. NIBR2454]
MQIQTTGLLRRVLANAGVLLGGRVVNAVISLAYMAVAARALGATGLGVLVLINAFAQLVGDGVKFQSWQTVLNYGAAPFAEDRKPDFQRVVRFTLFLDLVSGLVGVLVGIIGAILFDEELGWSVALAPAAAVYALSIFAMTPATPVGLLRLFNRFDLMSAQAAISSTVRLAGGLAAWWLKAPVEMFLLVWAAGTIAAFLYLCGVSALEMKRRDLLSGWSWRGPLTAGMPNAWRFAWATNFSATVDVMFTHVVTLVIGAVMGPAPAALWRVGRQVADALAKPAKLLIPALYPELARLRAAKGEAAMTKLAVQVGLLGGGVATLLLVVTIFAGGPILTLVMGPAFADAQEVMVWQVAAAVVAIWALPLEPMLVSLGQAGAALRVRLAVCVLYLGVLVPVVRTWGPNGAGAALVGAGILMGLGMLWALRRGYRLNPELNSLDSAVKSERNPD